MDIFELQKLIHKNAKNKKWYSTEMEDSVHIVSEANEVAEAVVNRIADSYLKPSMDKKNNLLVENELADNLFMILSFAAEYDYNIAGGIDRMLQKIKNRP